MNPIDTIQTISDKAHTIENTVNGIKVTFSHPVESLHQAGLWIVVHSEVFAVAAIVGILLWLFGLRAGKRLIQWSLALFALVAILSGAL